MSKRNQFEHEVARHSRGISVALASIRSRYPEDTELEKLLCRALVHKASLQDLVLETDTKLRRACGGLLREADERTTYTKYPHRR